ncbi:hypothetical protein [Mammaliicoccus vitulinus]|uniref:hypothetical protein n=1 Tax=Mammaliicoccus vitulinus TaxID=71237 RepID=UPI001868D989|nr:hypothetical protein [Mammaliicoccus vitulinus]
MNKEVANKLIELSYEHKRLHGEVSAFNRSLEKIDDTRNLFTNLFKEDDEKGVFAGLTVAENKIITDCQNTIKNIKEIEKEIGVLNGTPQDETVTSFEEWKMLNL